MFNLQILRGTTAKNDAYVGKEGELTFDTQQRALRIHDGVTAGGYQFPNDASVQALLTDRHLTVNNQFDLAQAEIFTTTISAAKSLSVAGVPAAGKVASFIVELINGGAHPITWWPGIQWAKGAAPQFTVAGKDVVGFYSYDGGVNWVGVSLGMDIK